MRKTISLLTLFAICTLISLKSFAVAGITGPTAVCSGASITLADSTAGGSWSSGSTSIATVSSTGVVYGVAAGTAVISYSTTGSTGAGTATYTVTVNASPAAISGSTTAICVGATATFTDATSGGTWSSEYTYTATVSGSGTTGTAGGVSVGTTLVSYTLTDGCYSTIYVSVNPAPTAGTLSGSTTICTGGTTTLATTGFGGTWHSASTSIATVVSSSGVVTGVSAGTVAISYTVTNSCGSATSTINVTVGAGTTPTTGTISGTADICPGHLDTLTDATGTSGGTWSSATPSVATVNSAGIVTGVSAGTSVISYTISSSCATVAATYTITVGAGATIDPISGPGGGGAINVCTGSTTTVTDSTTGGTWSSSATSVATIDVYGVIYPVATGSATISYSVSGTCGSGSVTRSVTVALGPGTLTGPTSVCTGANITVTDSAGATGGRWYSGPGSVASTSGTGSSLTVHGISAGTYTITYFLTSGSCAGSATATSITVLAPPTPPRPIAGHYIVCTGGSTPLTDSTSGGIWSTRNTSIATISLSGSLYGVTAGTDSVVYTVTNSCGSSAAYRLDTVLTGPATGTITGLNTVCSGSSITLTDTTSGGVWHSSNTSIASVSTSGVVTGASAGVDTIYYAETARCGTNYAGHLVTVMPLPSAGSISGSSTVCIGSTITLTDSVTGGSWSSSASSIASVNSSTGVVTGAAVGSVNITYTVTTTCGTATTVHAVSVVATPSAGRITGLSAVCTSSSITMYDSTGTGTGTWSSSSSSVASVSSTGVVTGRGVGSATISYTISGSCGTVYATRSVIVTTSAYAGTINGGTTFCSGASLMFNDTSGTGYGTWSTSDVSIATVDGAGTLYGVSAGTVNISYTVSSSCGTASATKTITVISASAGAITGASTVCVGATTALADGTSGGVWVSSNSSIASVNTSGVVTGASAGTATISYNVTNTCGTATAVKTMTVITSPAAPLAITGPATTCTGSTITLIDSTTGGTWGSSNNTIATVTTGGVVTGVATGIDTIIYTVSNTCGSSLMKKAVTVGAGPGTPASIGGTLSVCTGATTNLNDATTGGAWSSSNSSIASIGSTGIVTGVAAGTATISYTVTNACGSISVTASVTVNPAPTAGTISGASTVCAGVTTAFTDAVGGGTWSSAVTSIASVSSTGVVTGVAAGTTNIIYTVTGICGTATAIRSILVNPAPAVGSIRGGTSAICPGATTTYTDSVTGGVWSSSSTSIATVSSTGTVTGVATGTATISYSVTTGCGTIAATRVITINPGATAGTITGPTAICTGSTGPLSDSVTGGTWSSSNTAIATVSSTGVVTGVAIGTVTISYSVSNSCGTALTAVVMSVGGRPVAGVISGTASICTGTTTALSNTVSGGAWSSSNTAVATVNSAGVVTGVSGGSVTISYYVSSTCATAVATYAMSISPAGTAGTISGLATVCPGATITLTNSGASGGTWSSSNTARATVSSAGVVGGVSIGTFVITYAISNACGTSSATKSLTVNPLPAVSMLTGPSSVCVGSTITLADTITGTGTGWLSSNTAVASVSTAGVITGLASGTSIITYFLTNSCGTARTTHTVTVNTLTAGVLSGAATVAAGSTITLTSSAAGGAWSSLHTTLATIGSSTGIVTGVAAGSDTIVYTLTNACGTATAKKVVSVTAGREEGAEPVATQVETTDGIRLYPNPSTGSFILELPAATAQTQVIITDISGRVISQTSSDEKSISFDLSGFPAGAYIVSINADGKNYYRKVILQ